MRAFVGIFLLSCVPLLTAQEGEKQPEPEKKVLRSLTVVTGAGKEVPLKNWKIVAGTRKLALRNEPVKGAEKVDPGKEVEYFECREDTSTTYQDGILTLVPLASVRKLSFDAPKKSAALIFLDADGKEQTLTGTTEFKGFNQLHVDELVEVPDLGSAVVHCLGGAFKADPMIRAFQFADARPAPKVSGSAVIITSAGKKPAEHKVFDLKALYFAKKEKMSFVAASLTSKKDGKIDLTQIVKMREEPAKGKEKASGDLEVTLLDGKQTIVSGVLEGSDVPAKLVGLIARVPAGYKVFPPHTISNIRKPE